MTDGVLFLCHANVCRSRLMEYEFRAAEKATGGERWRSFSAGVAAAAGRPVCEEVRAVAETALAGADQLDTEKGAVQLDRILLADAGLVITATRAERGEVALLIPAMRSRTFTLREAVALARIEPSSAPLGGSRDPADVLTAFAESLDRRRGSVSAANKTRSRRWMSTRERSDDVDIPDAHHRRPRDHRRVLHTVQLEAVALHEQLIDFAGRGDRLGLRSPRSTL